MASLTDKVVLAAQTLIAAAGFAQAVSATDIRSQAAQLQSNYAEYTTAQISEKIASEIKKTHSPGISGSV